jgi:hypothetical protein
MATFSQQHVVGRLVPGRRTDGKCSVRCLCRAALATFSGSSMFHVEHQAGMVRWVSGRTHLVASIHTSAGLGSEIDAVVIAGIAGVAGIDRASPRQKKSNQLIVPRGTTPLNRSPFEDEGGTRRRRSSTTAMFHVEHREHRGHSGTQTAEHRQRSAEQPRRGSLTWGLGGTKMPRCPPSMLRADSATNLSPRRAIRMTKPTRCRLALGTLRKTRRPRRSASSFNPRHQPRIRGRRPRHQQPLSPSRINRPSRPGTPATLQRLRRPKQHHQGPHTRRCRYRPLRLPSRSPHPCRPPHRNRHPHPCRPPHRNRHPQRWSSPRPRSAASTHFLV